jgi:hypothetical protein
MDQSFDFRTWGAAMEPHREELQSLDSDVKGQWDGMIIPGQPASGDPTPFCRMDL